jgi:hypothetical protein
MESIGRLRLEAYAITLALAFIGIIVAVKRAELPAPFHYNYLSLLVGVFPISIGWLACTISIEIGMARGEGRAAIGTGIQVGVVSAVVNVLVLLGALRVLDIG